MPFRELWDEGDDQEVRHEIDDGGDGGGDGGGGDNGGDGGGGDNGGDGGGGDNGGDGGGDGGSNDYSNEYDGDGYVGNGGDNNFDGSYDSGGDNGYSFDGGDSSNDYSPRNYRYDRNDDGSGDSSSRSSRADSGNDFYDRMRQEEDDRRAERERQDAEERQRQEDEQRQRDLAEAEARRQEAVYQQSLQQGEGVDQLTPAEMMVKAEDAGSDAPLIDLPSQMSPHAALGQGRYGVGARWFNDPQTGERRWITADGDVHREDNNGYTSVIRSYGPQEQEGRDLYNTSTAPRYSNVEKTPTTQSATDPIFRPQSPVDVSPQRPDPIFRPQPPVDLPPSQQTAPPPESAQTSAQAAGIAAHAASAAGLPPEQVAAVAESAARIAADKQSLAQQSAWTRAAFRSTYGENADAEWVRQHNAELDRNQRLYGSREPAPGTRGLPGSGAPPAPNRRIGATPPPGPGQDARYGVNWNVAPKPAAAATAPPYTGNTEPPARGNLPSQPTAAQQVAANVANPRAGEPPARGNIPLQPLEPTTFQPPNVSANVANPRAGEPPARGNLPAQPPSDQIVGASPAPSDQPRTSPSTQPDLPYQPPSYQPPADAVIVPPLSQMPDIVDTRAQDEGPHEQTPVLTSSTATDRVGPPPAEVTENGPGIGQRAFEPPAQYQPQSYQAPTEERIPGTLQHLNNEVALDAQGNVIENGYTARMSNEEITPGPTDRVVVRRIAPGVNGEPVGYETNMTGADLARRTPEERARWQVVGRYDPATNGVAAAPAAPVRDPALPSTPGYNVGQFTRALPADTRDVDAGPREANAVTPPDPVAQAVQTTTPINTLATMVGQAQGKTPEQAQTDAYHIAQGISGLLQGKEDARWSEAYLNDTARLAWARENAQAGRTVDPRNTPTDYIETWKDAFYGSDHNVPLVKELDQQMIDFGASKTPPGKSFNWQASFGQYGEKGMISTQYTGVDCGPNAFSTIARSRGVNMTPQQALPFAEQHGYHDGNQFTGPENYARMLRTELGLDAKTGRLDADGWKAVDSELAAGRPVTISSPGHYWVVTGKNDQGQYYAGSTNTVLRGRGNQEWVDKGAFAFGGQADTFITAKGDVDPNARAIKEMHLQPPATTPQSTRGNLTQMVSSGERTTNTLSAPSDMNGQIRRMRNETTTTGPRQEISDPRDAVPSERPVPERQSPAEQVGADPRISQAAQENVWSNEQPVRHSLMTEYQQRPYEERQAIFDDAMDRGLTAEGITGDEAERWKRDMRQIATGEGLGVPGENPDLNPFIIAGESGGRPGTANRANSSATGYFQLIDSNRDGSDFAFQGYRPKQYGNNAYDPVGQVRQFVRAIRASTYRGDPDRAVADKRANGHYNIIVSRREQVD